MAGEVAEVKTQPQKPKATTLHGRGIKTSPVGYQRRGFSPAKPVLLKYFEQALTPSHSAARVAALIRATMAFFYTVQSRHAALRSSHKGVSMKVGAIIIGDELLSGKRQDKHLPQLIQLLAARGIKLSWVEYIGDDAARLTATFCRSLNSPDLVFSFGGIGATPDDLTRACAAHAAGVPLKIHPDGQAIVEERFGAEAYPHRINMVNIPCGSSLIPNPVNQMPGFSFAHHHFVPGFPSMAWPMVEWVLDTHYRHLFDSTPDIELTVLVPQAREGNLIDIMQAFVRDNPALKLSSLPSFGTASLPPHIEFGVTGAPLLAEPAMHHLVEALKGAGYTPQAVVHRAAS